MMKKKTPGRPIRSGPPPKNPPPKPKLISWGEAIRQETESYEKLQREIAEMHAAESEYWCDSTDEDRVKELEDVLRWLLHLHHNVSKGGGTPSNSEWEEALATAHKVLDK